MRKLNLRGKIILFVMATSLVVYVVTFTYIAITVNNKSYRDAERIIVTKAEEMANLISASINEDVGVALGLAAAMQDYANIERPLRDSVFHGILENTLLMHDDYVGVWDSWQLQYFDKNWGNKPGRYSTSYYWDKNSTIQHYSDFKDIGGIEKYTGYHQVMESKEVTLMEPYLSAYKGDEEVIESTIAVPILTDGEFAGLVGIDITLQRFKELLDELTPFDNGYFFLMSNEANYIAHPDEETYGKNFRDINAEDDSIYHITEKIRAGEIFQSTSSHSDTGEDIMVLIVPVQITKIDKPWALGIIVPIHSVMEDSERIVGNLVIAAILGLIVLTLMVIVLATRIVSPIKQGVEFAKEIGNGNLAATIDIQTEDEIGQMTSSLKGMADRLRNIILELKESSTEMGQFSAELKTNADEFQNMTIVQQEATDKVFETIHTITESIEETSEHAQSTQKIAVTAEKNLEKGTSKATDSNKAMTNIAEKIQIINDIAFQTNILALNAAVEAARAGDEGKGFAVVANEVKKLSERSKDAATEINELSIDGVDIATETGELLTSVLPEIKRTANLVQSISNLGDKQKIDLDQINSAVSRLNEIVQQVNMFSSNIADNSDKFESISQKLNELVGFFKT